MPTCSKSYVSKYSNLRNWSLLVLRWHNSLPIRKTIKCFKNLEITWSAKLDLRYEFSEKNENYLQFYDCSGKCRSQFCSFPWSLLEWTSSSATTGDRSPSISSFSSRLSDSFSSSSEFWSYEFRIIILAALVSYQNVCAVRWNLFIIDNTESSFKRVEISNFVSKSSKLSLKHNYLCWYYTNRLNIVVIFHHHQDICYKFQMLCTFCCCSNHWSLREYARSHFDPVIFDARTRLIWTTPFVILIFGPVIDQPCKNSAFHNFLKIISVSLKLGYNSFTWQLVSKFVSFKGFAYFSLSGVLLYCR